jgi:hypothetical protein
VPRAAGNANPWIRAGHVRNEVICPLATSLASSSPMSELSAFGNVGPAFSAFRTGQRAPAACGTPSKPLLCEGVTALMSAGLVPGHLGRRAPFTTPVKGALAIEAFFQGENSMRFFGRTTVAAIAASLAMVAVAAVENHGSVIYTSATCNPAATSVTVFGTNTSASSAGFVANVSVNGGPVFQSPIIFDGTPEAIPGNSSGSFTFSDAQFVVGAVVVLTNDFGATGQGAGSSVTAQCGPAAPPRLIPTFSAAGLAALFVLLALAGFAAIRFQRR